MILSFVSSLTIPQPRKKPLALGKGKDMALNTASWDNGGFRETRAAAPRCMLLHILDAFPGAGHTTPVLGATTLLRGRRGPMRASIESADWGPLLVGKTLGPAHEVCALLFFWEPFLGFLLTVPAEKKNGPCRAARVPQPQQNQWYGGGNTDVALRRTRRRGVGSQLTLLLFPSLWV